MDVEILMPGGLQVERLFNGERRLQRDMNVQLDDEILHIPAGFTTDYSSWPTWLVMVVGFASLVAFLLGAPAWALVVGILLMILLAGPRFSRVDIAGVVHDLLFRLASLGYDGRPVGYFEANWIWACVARAGGSPKARASLFWATAGFIGLTLGSWPVWLRYRWADRG